MDPDPGAVGGASGAGGALAANAGNSNPASAGSASAGAAGASSGGAAPGGASSGGSSGFGTITAASLFPLTVGNRWTYQVSGADADCAAGPHDASLVGTVTQGGEQALDFRDYCSEDSPRYLRSSGDEIWEYQAEWARSLAQPLQEGYSWMFTSNYQLSWHFAGTVTVPAGKFDNCWQRTATSGNNFTASRTYCPGVGPVDFSNSSGEEATLLSYSLK